MSADKKRFQVWHQAPDGPIPVAQVDVGNLLGAAILTMNRTDEHWHDNERVMALIRYGRSTDIGDVIVSPEGIAYEITATKLGFVFDMIDFPPYREHMGVLQEWANDYSAAKDRDLREQFHQIASGSFKPPQAANDNHSRDYGIER